MDIINRHFGQDINNKDVKLTYHLKNQWRVESNEKYLHLEDRNFKSYYDVVWLLSSALAASQHNILSSPAAKDGASVDRVNHHRGGDLFSRGEK